MNPAILQTLGGAALGTGLAIALAAPIGVTIINGLWGAVHASKEAKTLAALLRLDPTTWDLDTHTCHHPVADVGIWISNNAYGLHWWQGGQNSWHLSTSNDFTQRDRRLVWTAYNDMLKARKPAAASIQTRLENAIRAKART